MLPLGRYHTHTHVQIINSVIPECVIPDLCSMSSVTFSSPLIFSGSECGAPQPEPAQVFCASGGRERCRVDGGRGGIPEEEIPEDHGVQWITLFITEHVFHLKYDNIYDKSRTFRTRNYVIYGKSVFASVFKNLFFASSGF